MTLDSVSVLAAIAALGLATVAFSVSYFGDRRGTRKGRQRFKDTTWLAAISVLIVLGGTLG